MRLFKRKHNNLKPLTTQAQPLPPSAGTEGWVSLYESISRLIEHGYVGIDINTPRTFLSLTCYRAFMCDSKGIMLDDNRASAFLGNIRHYINFQRAYISGLHRSSIDSDSFEEIDIDESKWLLPPIDNNKWIDLYISGSDNQSTLLFGRWNSDSIELKPYCHQKNTDLNTDIDTDTTTDIGTDINTDTTTVPED